MSTPTDLVPTPSTDHRQAGVGSLQGAIIYGVIPGHEDDLLKALLALWEGEKITAEDLRKAGSVELIPERILRTRTVERSTATTSLYDGQVVKLQQHGHYLWLVRPEDQPTGLVGPFLEEERQLVLEVASSHFSFGQPCPHGNMPEVDPPCQECAADDAGDVRSHYQRENPPDDEERADSLEVWREHQEMRHGC